MSHRFVWLDILLYGLQVQRHLPEVAIELGVEPGPSLTTWGRCIDAGLVVC